MTKEFLEHLLDFEMEIDPVKAFNLLKVFGQIGDKLILRCDDTGGFFAIQSHLRLLWTIQHMLNRLPAEERDEKLIAAFKEGQSLALLCTTTFSIQSCHEKPVEHGPASVLSKIKTETVDELKHLALTKISEFAKENRLIDIPMLPFVLFRWQGWGENDASKSWASNLVSDPELLVRFLATFLEESRSLGFEDSVGRVHHTLNFKDLAEFIDLDQVEETLLKIENIQQLNSESQLAVTSFKEQYPDFKLGNNPEMALIE